MFPLAGFVGGVLSDLGRILGGGGTTATATAPPKPTGAAAYLPWILGGVGAFFALVVIIVLAKPSRA